MEEVRELRLGELVLRIEGDLIIARAHGELLMPVAEALLDLFREMCARYERYFLIVDLNKASTIPAEVRRKIVLDGKKYTPVALAFFGGSFLVRGVNAMLVSAVSLLSDRPIRAVQLATEQQARDWIAAQRERLEKR